MFNVWTYGFNYCEYVLYNKFSIGLYVLSIVSSPINWDAVSAGAGSDTITGTHHNDETIGFIK